jgi:hypothetical protein
MDDPGTFRGRELFSPMHGHGKGKAALRQAFRDLEREVPEKVARVLRRLRHPDARWIRIPAGLLLILGGIFSILPVLGIWMLPFGLLLLALDVPVLREPVSKFTSWSVRQWASLKQRLVGRSPP